MGGREKGKQKKRDVKGKGRKDEREAGRGERG